MSYNLVELPNQPMLSSLPFSKLAPSDDPLSLLLKQKPPDAYHSQASVLQVTAMLSVVMRPYFCHNLFS